MQDFRSILRCRNKPHLHRKTGIDVTAMDVSDGAVKLSKERMHKEKLDLNLLVGSFLALPFKNDDYGFVFDIDCFHHVEIRKRAAFIKVNRM